MTSTFRRLLFLFVSVGLILVGASMARADALELLSGIKLQGEILEKSDSSVSIRVTIAGRSFNRTYKLADVHAITVGETRDVINERTKGKSASPAPSKTGDPKAKGNPQAPAGTGVARTREQIDALIRQAAQNPPWYDETPLNFPQTLDLSFPERPGGGWNNQVNVGQYVWDIINPNPSRWHEGIKLLHHLLEVNKGKTDVEARVMSMLGEKYHDLLEDYARAAYWWRQAGTKQLSLPAAVELAECYWKLGNKQMAVEQLRKVSNNVKTIKLLADMGDLELARKLTDAARKTDPGTATTALLHLADGYRSEGQFKKALDYYNQVLGIRATGKNGNDALKRQHDRAQASAEAIKLFELTDVKQVPDGTYQASSLGYEGQVAVEVKVAGGRIESVRVTQHREKQFYSALTDTPRKIIDKQGVKGVDATSSATITSEAIINATAKALAGAGKQ
jgi:uncharacterized protein with FMN-binding domain